MAAVEGSFLQEEVGSEVIVLGAVGNLVVDGVIAEVNSETMVIFQGELEDQQDRKEKILNG